MKHLYPVIWLRGGFMCCGKGDRGMFLCPISFGFAFGVTWMIGMFIAGIWMMYHGVPPVIATMFTGPFTWTDVFVFSLVGLLKGFIFGLLLALFYDLFICCKHHCGRHKDMVSGKCACGSACNCVGVCKCCSNMPKELK